MFREEKNIKNLKDINPTLLPPLSGEGWERLSYTKTDKLITALYMVTDIIDKDEPLRNKLRTLGIEILSDISSRPSNICIKISEIMSFLDIASAMDIISGMNFSILKKEFLELNQSIIDFTGGIKNTNRQINLSEFFREGFSPLHLSPHPNPLLKGEGEKIPTTPILTPTLADIKNNTQKINLPIKPMKITDIKSKFNI